MTEDGCDDVLNSSRMSSGVVTPVKREVGVRLFFDVLPEDRPAVGAREQPSVSRCSRSRRMVIPGTPSRSLSAETRTPRCSASISEMRPCRSAGSISHMSGDDIGLPKGRNVLSDSLRIARFRAILRLALLNVKCSELCECVFAWENVSACCR